MVGGFLVSYDALQWQQVLSYSALALDSLASAAAGSPLICDKNRRNLDFATIPYLPRALLNH